MKNKIIRNDETTSTNKAKVTNITVSENYTKSRENGYQVIKIGDSNKTITGSHSYIIKYTYDIGKDPLKDADELYFNLIGDEWDTTIKNVTFKITMPKTFDKSLLGFSSGKKGSVISSNVSYDVNENVISGFTKNSLYANQALTVRLTLPEGYFVGTKANIDYYSIITIIISIAFVIIAWKLWSKYGKDDAVVETVEFYPPQGLNSAEVGLLYNGNADNKAVISLLIYLANKGYLKIEETVEQGLIKEKKGFRITKLKPYDGNNENEKLFLSGLFTDKIVKPSKILEIMKQANINGQKISFSEATEIASSKQEKNTVTKSDLYDRFYVTLDHIKANLNGKENKNQIFEAIASSKMKWLAIMAIILHILITIKPVYEYSGSSELVMALIFTGVGLFTFLYLLIGKTPITVKIFGVLWGLGFCVGPWCGIVLPAIKNDVMYTTMYFIGLLSIIALVIFVKIMPKRTPYGNEMLGKLRGFKTFLETAQKSQLEMLVAQNPEYFYNILPYTYALGVSDVWMKQFETIAIKAPDWYDSPNAFDMMTFEHFMSSTMESAATAMSSSPSSSSSSGGGSSGGGSGGGGGGSW